MRLLPPARSAAGDSALQHLSECTVINRFALHAYRQTLLHAAAVHKKADCMQLLVAKGASTTALDAQGQSALQLASLYCGALAVRALLRSGDWMPELGFECLLNASIAYDPACLELLLKRERESSSSSSSSDLSSRTTAQGMCTLLHAAAAWGRQVSVGMLLRYGCAVGALSATGKSPAALAAADDDQLPAQLQRTGILRPAVPARQQVVLQLLRSGEEIEAAAMTPAHGVYNSAVQQFVLELQQRLAAQTEALTVLADNAYRSGADVNIAAISNSSLDALQQQQTIATDASGTAQQYIVSVQLMHATTGERARAVYTIDTKLLAALHTQRGETGASVLASMLVAPSSWGAAATTTDAVVDTVKYLQYDDDVDFSESRFECVLQYYYTASVQGATSGAVDIDKLQATLQAAQFFGLDQLAAAAKEFAKASGITVQ
jgi:Ankyrin repeat